MIAFAVELAAASAAEHTAASAVYQASVLWAVASADGCDVRVALVVVYMFAVVDAAAGLASVSVSVLAV